MTEPINILSCASIDDVKNALKSYKISSVQNFHKESFLNHFLISGIVKEMNVDYECNVDLSIKSDGSIRILNHYCTCSNTSHNENLCEHLIVLIIYYNDIYRVAKGINQLSNNKNLDEHNDIKRQINEASSNNLEAIKQTEKEAERIQTSKVLSDFFMRSGEANFSLFNKVKYDSRKKISLIPKIYSSFSNDNILTYSLKLNITDGYNEYVIRDIQQFIDNTKFSKFFSYGKNLAFLHSVSVLDEKSKKLFNNICRCYISQKSNVYKNVSRRNKDKMQISQQFLSQIINDNIGNKIIFHEKPLNILDENPLFNVAIEKKINGIEIIITHYKLICYDDDDTY